MTFIYGDPEDLTKTHILIARFDSDEYYKAIQYVETFSECHPTYGCQMFPEFTDPEGYTEAYIRVKWNSTNRLHQVYGLPFSALSNKQLIELVLGAYPPYSEDDDPEVTPDAPSLDILDSMTGAFPVVTLKSPLDVPTEELWRRTLFEPPGPPPPKIMADVVVRSEVPEEYVIRDIKNKILSDLAKIEDCWSVIQTPGHFPGERHLRVVFHPEKLMLPR